MKTIIASGRVTNGTGCAVSVVLFKEGKVVSTHHYHTSFQDSFSVDPGSYTITIEGITGGTLHFVVTGGLETSVIPPVDATFQKEISGVYDFNVS
jgi:hypothetical protein